MILATLVMSRQPDGHAGQGGVNVASGGRVQPAPPADENDVIKLVSDQQALLPEADGDLAIIATPRYRQAERYVLGQSAVR
jgi:hypothetical protein